MNYAYITVLTGSDYLDGVRTLLYSLKKTGSRFPMVVLVPADLDPAVQKVLLSWGCKIEYAPKIDLGEFADKNPRPYWNETFFKLRIFAMEQYDKLLYIDSDMIVLDNLDHLFECGHITAVQGGKLIYGWEDINSGLMLIEPDAAEFEQLMAHVPQVCERKISENCGFGDQDVISYYYKNVNRKWEGDHRLDERYNANIRCIHELCVHFGFKNMKVIHFVGAQKPWMFTFGEMMKYLIQCVRCYERYRAMCAAKYFGYVFESKFWKCKPHGNLRRG